MSTTTRPTSARSSLRATSLKTFGEVPPSPPAASAELTRLQNLLRSKEREADEQAKEIAALKCSISLKDRAIDQKQKDCESLKERTLQAEGNYATASKELIMVKNDKKKLDTQVADLMRSAEKLQDKLRLAGLKNPGAAEQLASLQSELKSVKSESEKLIEHDKALEAIIRNKDKHMAITQKKADEAVALGRRCGELENQCRELSRQLEEVRADNKTLQMVDRNRTQEMSKLIKDLEGAKASLMTSHEALSASAANLRASQKRCADLEMELSIKKDELARSSAVAARVAMSEVKAGSKAEGTVTIAQHMEEVRYLTGENSRLKDKIDALGKELTVSHELKERFKRASMTPTRRSSMSRPGSAGGARRGSLVGLLAGSSLLDMPDVDTVSDSGDKDASLVLQAHMAEQAV